MIGFIADCAPIYLRGYPGPMFLFLKKLEKKNPVSLQEEEEDVPPPAPISPLPTVYVSGPPLETNNNNNKGFVP